MELNSSFSFEFREFYLRILMQDPNLYALKSADKIHSVQY